MSVRNMPIQKNQPHVVYCPAIPAKKMPVLVLLVPISRRVSEKMTYKNPIGAQAP